MTGITFSAEQIREAPPEVRRWIEQELSASLGLGTAGGQSARVLPQLLACGREEVAALLTLIQGVFPAVNVFFELGRRGSSAAQGRLQAYQLADIQHHTRLQNTEQVVTCLNLINDALRQIRGSPTVSFYALDGGYCLIATETQQSIRALWFELLSEGNGSERASGDESLVQEPAAAGTGGSVPGSSPGPQPSATVPSLA